jgi:hypothetical protein
MHTSILIKVGFMTIKDILEMMKIKKKNKQQKNKVRPKMITFSSDHSKLLASWLRSFRNLKKYNSLHKLNFHR